MFNKNSCLATFNSVKVDQGFCKKLILFTCAQMKTNIGLPKFSISLRRCFSFELILAPMETNSLSIRVSVNFY